MFPSDFWRQWSLKVFYYMNENKLKTEKNKNKKKLTKHLSVQK